MLKSTLRVFMIGILCGNLLLLDYNYKLGALGFTQAYADGVKQEESDIKDNDLLSTLTMISIGTVTSRLISCKATPDMMAAAAGGIAFIAGEILAFAKLKKNLKGYEEYIRNDLSAEELNHQIAIFEKIREGYEKAVETANTKVKLQQAAAAAFVVAAGLATAFYMSVTTSFQACNTALTAAATACYAAFAATCVPPSTCYTPFKTAATGFMKSIPSRAAAFAGYNVPAISSTAGPKDTTTETTAGATDSSNAAMCPAGSAAPAACAGYATMKANFGGVCPASGLVASAERMNTQDSLANNLLALKGINPTFFSALIMKMIATEASAFSIMGVAASTAVKFIIATSKTIALKIDMFLYNPKNRAIVWGVLAALTYAASKSTQNVITELKSRIAKIDEIIADLKSRGLGQTIDPATNQPGNLAMAGSNLSGGGLNAVTTNSDDTNNVNSIKSEGIELESALPCATKMVNGKCDSFERSFIGSSGFESLDPMTKKELLSIAKNVDGINGKKDISGASLDALGKMGSNVNALNARLAKSNKLLDKIAKDNNENNLMQTRDSLKNDFLNAVKNELKKDGQTASSLYASISGTDTKNTSGTGTSALAVGSKDSKKGTGMSAEDRALFDQINALGKSSQPSYDSLSHSAGELGSDEVSNLEVQKMEMDYNVERANARRRAAARNTISKHDAKDISDDPDKNIFDVISNRYQKSGFARLFPKKKSQMIFDR